MFKYLGTTGKFWKSRPIHLFENSEGIKQELFNYHGITWLSPAEDDSKMMWSEAEFMGCDEELDALVEAHNSEESTSN